jgi:hypothetical protein
MGRGVNGNLRVPIDGGSIQTAVKVSSPELVKDVTIGIQKTGTTTFYDWGVASSTDGGTTWSRSPSVPSVEPHPTCTGGVSSGITWEVKYRITLKTGKEIFGVSTEKIDRIRDCASPTLVSGSFTIDGKVLAAGTTVTASQGSTIRAKISDDTRISLVRVKLVATGINSTSDPRANLALQNGLVGDRVTSPQVSETFLQGMFVPAGSTPETKWAITLEIQDGTNPSVFVDGGFVIFNS